MFYRGKDFLPSAVSSAIEERRRNRMDGDKLVADGSSGETTDKILRGTEGQHAAFVSEKSKGQTMRNVSQEQKMRSVQTNIARTSRKLSMVSIQKNGVSTKGFSFLVALGFHLYRLLKRKQGQRSFFLSWSRLRFLETQRWIKRASQKKRDTCSGELA